MRILAIDTALEACAAAVLDTEQGKVASETLPMVRGHAEALLPLIQRVMRQADLAFAALDRIAVTTGPGSFTGLRVGISAARGIALAAGKPAVGLTTLSAFAAPLIAQDDQTSVAVAIDARHDHVYLQVFADTRVPANSAGWLRRGRLSDSPSRRPSSLPGARRGQRHQPLPFDDPPQRVEAEWLGQDRQHLQPATRADPADVVEQRRLAAAHDLDRAAIADARQLAQGVDRIRIAKEEIEKDDLGRAVTEDFEHRRSAGEMLSRDAEAGQRGGHQPADRGFIVEDEAERSRGCPGRLGT